MTKEEAIYKAKHLRKVHPNICVDSEDFWDTVIAALEQEPSRSENPNKWIPVSEGLPEENGGYFVTVKRGYVTTAIWVGTAEFWSEVTAWMPLPEPYKESPTGAEGSEE